MVPSAMSSSRQADTSAGDLPLRRTSAADAEIVMSKLKSNTFVLETALIKLQQTLEARDDDYGRAQASTEVFEC